jgi:uncharacterized membrane protein
MNWLQFAVQWLHVLLGITWFGYAISMYFFVGPALASMPGDQLRATYGRLGDVGTRVFPIVGVLVLLLGIIRGTVFGPIQSFDALWTAYGITWLVALVTTIALFVNGARNIGPSFTGLKVAPDVAVAAQRLQGFARIDLVLFGIVFTCMILMRFGY